MDEKVNNLVDWLNKQYGDTYLYEVQKLKVRYRITHKYINPKSNTADQNSTSVYCFVDFEGNILKAATWSTPAKGLRGHVDNLNTTDLGKYGTRTGREGIIR